MIIIILIIILFVFTIFLYSKRIVKEKPLSTIHHYGNELKTGTYFYNVNDKNFYKILDINGTNVSISLISSKDIYLIQSYQLGNILPISEEAFIAERLKEIRKIKL